MGSYPPDDTDECYQCEGDLWDGNDYNGVRLLEESAWMCKVCERIALQEGTHQRIRIEPPHGWLWIARALSYAKAAHSSIVCAEWSAVESTANADAYEWGAIDENVLCIGNVIVRAMDNDYELDYLEDALFQKALEKESSVYLFTSQQDTTGIRIAGGPAVLDTLLDEVQLALVRNKDARLFIASPAADSPLAKTWWKRYFYQGENACTWYRLREELKEAWLERMEWWQYALQECL